MLNHQPDNAARHMRGSSPIRIAAGRDGVHVPISASVEGRGIPPGRLPHLFRKYAGAVDDDRDAGGGLIEAIVRETALAAPT